MRLARQDAMHLRAAEGWLGLGHVIAANEELDCITASNRGLPAVLAVRWSVYAAAKKWDLSLEIAQFMASLRPKDPIWHLNHAHALVQLGRTPEAIAVLTKVTVRFSDNWFIRYRLAQYFCKTGRFKEALAHLEKAIDMAGKKDIRAAALDEPALQPLWNHIGDL